MTKLHTLFLFMFGITGAFLLAGCAYTYKGKLLEGIKTIEVNTFGNTTYYTGLEGTLTRNVITAVNLSPGLKAVNSKGDATLTGTITAVNRITTAYDGNNQPMSQVVTITARINVQDNRTGDMLITNMLITNSTSSSEAGSMRLDQGQTWTSARDAALQELARLIARKLYDKW